MAWTLPNWIQSVPKVLFGKIKSALQAQDKTNATTQSAIVELQKTVKAQAATISTLSGKVDTVMADLTALQTKVDAACAQLDQAAQIIPQLNQTIAALQAKINTLPPDDSAGVQALIDELTAHSQAFAMATTPVTPAPTDPSAPSDPSTPSS